MQKPSFGLQICTDICLQTLSVSKSDQFFQGNTMNYCMRDWWKSTLLIITFRKWSFDVQGTYKISQFKFKDLDNKMDAIYMNVSQLNFNLKSETIFFMYLGWSLLSLLNPDSNQFFSGLTQRKFGFSQGRNFPSLR